MTRSDLTTKLSLRMKVSKKEADKYLTAFLDAIMESLENGDRVVMQGFGSFHVNEHKARMAKKPITGEPIYLPLRKKPVFNAGKELRDIINGRVPVPSSKGKRTPARVKEPRSTFDNVHGIQQQINMPD
jgi:DNA-binding protein HU-beta